MRIRLVGSFERGKELKESVSASTFTEGVTKLMLVKWNESPRRKHSPLKSSPRKRKCTEKRGWECDAYASSPRVRIETTVEMHDYEPPVISSLRSSSKSSIDKDNVIPTWRSHRIAKMKLPKTPKSTGVERYWWDTRCTLPHSMMSVHPRGEVIDGV